MPKRLFMYFSVRMFIDVSSDYYILCENISGRRRKKNKTKQNLDLQIPVPLEDSRTPGWGSEGEGILRNHNATSSSDRHTACALEEKQAIARYPYPSD